MRTTKEQIPSRDLQSNQFDSQPYEAKLEQIKDWLESNIPESMCVIERRSGSLTLYCENAMHRIEIQIADYYEENTVALSFSKKTIDSSGAITYDQGSIHPDTIQPGSLEIFRLIKKLIAFLIDKQNLNIRIDATGNRIDNYKK